MHPRLAVDLIVASSETLVDIQLEYLQYSNSTLIPEGSLHLSKLPREFLECASIQYKEIALIMLQKVLKKLGVLAITQCDLNFVTCLMSQTKQLESLEISLGGNLLLGDRSLQKHLERIVFPGELVSLNPITQ